MKVGGQSWLVLRDLHCDSSTGIVEARAGSHGCNLPFAAKCWWSTLGSSHPLKEKKKKVKNMVYMIYIRRNDTLIHVPI